MYISSPASVVAAWWSLSPSSSTASTVRLPLQPTTPHWETPSMAVRAIFLPVCHRRTAQGLPNWIQTMFGRAVFYSTISIDDINAQSGWSLKTEKIRLKWHVCFDTTHTIRHLFLTWTSLYPSLHFLNLTQSYAALPLAFFTSTCIAYLNCT
jgi:hypothetical protein